MTRIITKLMRQLYVLPHLIHLSYGHLFSLQVILKIKAYF